MGIFRIGLLLYFLLSFLDTGHIGFKKIITAFLDCVFSFNILS